MGKSGAGRFLSKLATGIVLICFFEAVVNVLLLKWSADPPTAGHDTTRQPSRIANATVRERSAPHTPENLLLWKKKSTAAKTKATNDDVNNDNKPTTSNDDRDGSTYTCSYGPTKENRTLVTIPKHTPAFVMAGVQKSGSTALSRLFMNHSQMLPPKNRREVHFFDTRYVHWADDKAKQLGLKQANDRHCLVLECYMTLFDTETILANSQTLAHTTTTTNTTTATTTTTNRHYLPLFAYEKTPSYFANPKVPERMKHTIPWSKVILVLRNPVDRLYSHYKMTIRNKFELRKYSLEDILVHELKAMKDIFHMTTAPIPIPIGIVEQNATDASIPTMAKDYDMPTTVPSNHTIPFTKWNPRRMAIVRKLDAGPLKADADMVRKGMYAEQLKWWLDHYTVGHDLLVLDYADVCKNTQAVYERVLGFVGIPLSNDTLDFDRQVRADDRKDHRPFRESTKKYLREFYRPYNAQLEELLGPDWNIDKLGWE